MVTMANVLAGAEARTERRTETDRESLAMPEEQFRVTFEPHGRTVFVLPGRMAGIVASCEPCGQRDYPHAMRGLYALRPSLTTGLPFSAG